MPAGYSRTPLAKKLGLREGGKLWAPAMPDSVRAEIEETARPAFAAGPGKALPAAHIFHTRKAMLAAGPA